jgi:hypothetical protein
MCSCRSSGASVQEYTLKKKIALILACCVIALGLVSAVYVIADKSHRPSTAENSPHEPGQIQAPPHPPRTKPIERVIVVK